MPRITKTFILLLALVAGPGTASASIIINEICWMGARSSADDEWIELYNPTKGSVALDGWALKTADNGINIKLEGEIPGSGFFLLERTNDETLPGIPADQIYAGALNNAGEKLMLADSNGQVINEVDCSSGWLAGDNTTKQTMERDGGNWPAENAPHIQAGWQTSAEPGGTPKETNSTKRTANDREEVKNSEKLMAGSIEELWPQSQSLEALPLKTNYPKNIFINEALPSPEGSDTDNEWVEIYNANNFEVDISGWQIQDKAGAAKTYTFPPGTKIQTNGFFVLTRQISKIALQNNGDGLELSTPAGEMSHSTDYPAAPQGQSYNLTKNGWAWSTTPSPGSYNVVTQPEVTKTASKQQPTAATSSGLIRQTKILADIEKSAERPQGKALIILIGGAAALASAMAVVLLKKRADKQYFT